MMPWYELVLVNLLIAALSFAVGFGMARSR